MTGPLPLGTSPDVPDVPRAVRVSSMKVLTEVCIENVPCWNPGRLVSLLFLVSNHVLVIHTRFTGII